MKEQGTTSRKNKILWIYPEYWPHENKVTQIISVLKYSTEDCYNFYVNVEINIWTT